MSFSDRPSYGSWQHIGCLFLGLALAMGNALFLATWYFSFYDLSAETYRPLRAADLIVPAILLGSIAVLWLYVRFVMRGKD